MGKKTVVIGATDRPDRYAFLAAKKLLAHGHPIELVGQKDGEVGGVKIHTDQPQIPEVDTVTMYVGTRNQGSLYDYILSLKPKRVIFNPGTENPEFEKRLVAAGIEAVEGCTLVMLSSREY